VRFELRPLFRSAPIRIEWKRSRYGRAVVVLLVAKRASRVLLLFGIFAQSSRGLSLCPDAVTALLHLFAVQCGVLLDSATEISTTGERLDRISMARSALGPFVMPGHPCGSSRP